MARRSTRSAEPIATSSSSDTTRSLLPSGAPDRLMDLGVERLADGGHHLQAPRCSSGVEQLLAGVDHPGRSCLSVSVAGSVDRAASKRVEHRHQLTNHPLGCAVDHRGLFPSGALPVVVEVGGHPSQVVEI